VASVDEAWSRPAPSASRLSFVAKLAALGVAYFLAARFGIEQDVAHGVITPVWAPSGIAIAALLLFGPRYWPGVAAGAFVANATSDVALPIAGAIAIGNTLEAVVAESLLSRVGFAHALSRVRDVLWFVVFAAVVATTVSATVGVTALTTAGDLAGSRYVEEWLLWWFGDLIGTLLVAPPLLTWVTAYRRRSFPGRRVEGAILAALLIAAASVIFLEGNWRYPYVIFPLLVWAALRFSQVGATTAILLVGGIATWGTANGAVPIGGTSATQAVQILQGLIAIVGVGIFLTAATIAERDDAEGERTRALAQLHERNSMYETLLQTVSDLGEGFVVTDAGRLVFANAAYCEMTGYTYEELLELPSLVELTAPEEREEIANRLRERLAGGRVVDHYEAALIRKDGRRVECEVAVELAQTDEGPRIVSLVRDVTERKKIETFRANFVSYAAHELRSPISIIGGFVDLLRRAEPRDPDETEDALERISANVATMRARIENMLALTRIERREVTLRPEPVELETFLHGIAESMPPPEGTSLDVDAPRGTSAWLDRSALEQIIANLLTNSYRYGGPRVRLAARSSGSATTIEVSDDGTGIPDGEVDRMFEPFVRGNTPRKSDGAGLGLSIVKALVEASGGTIHYSSAGASTFAVSVPAAPQEGVT
jgi:PAS domain S-box-containing protein